MHTTLTTTLAALLVGLAAPAPAASHPGGGSASAEKLYVVATLGVLGDLAETVGGALVKVEVLSDPRQDPHFVEPRPTLMQKARKADVFIEIGLQLELWADKVASGSGNTRIQMGQPGRVIASAGIATLELPAVLSREWGDVHPYGNPHVWLDPLNAGRIAGNIADAFAAVDPAHAEEYGANLAAFKQRVDVALFGPELLKQVGSKMLARLARGDRLHEYLERRDLAQHLGGWLAKAAPLRGRPIVTYHKTCVYFAERFGFTIPLEIEEKPGIPASARFRDHVVEVMEAKGVRTILLETYYNPAAAEYLARKTSARVAVVPIDVGAAVGAPHYFDLIDLILDRAIAAETAPRD